MTKTFLRQAPKLALALVAALVSAPMDAAHAGSLSLSLNARTAQEARFLNTAITLYALHRDMKSGADLRQTGRNNAASLFQSGGRNRAIIHQEGRDHTARLSQTGGQNAQVILQFGRGAQADITQTGGQAGILLQFGR
ncbi:MAG: curlin repeat-containing protein [Rhodobacteraceae bacterium]|nr:curlin repeat-containing protein [Paracoccaceae bacterium]